jgi:hypothetical protein
MQLQNMSQMNGDLKKHSRHKTDQTFGEENHGMFESLMS